MDDVVFGSVRNAGRRIFCAFPGEIVAAIGKPNRIREASTQNVNSSDRFWKTVKHVARSFLRRGIQALQFQEEISGELGSPTPGRSEERRVGKECRSRWSPYH